MKKALLAGAAVLVLALAVVYVTLVAATYAPEACTYELDLPELRRLADSMPGPKPKEIRVEAVTNGKMPMAIACAGSGWDLAPLGVYAYQLVYDDKTLIVDSAMTRAQADDLGMSDGYDEAAWQRTAKAMQQASAVYVTHEHTDHMGGAVAGDAWAAQVHLTPPQLDSDVRSRPVISSSVHAAIKPLAYEKYGAVAPGVVLIAAPGHTPGSQMVFVSRADGVEVILTGDTAWLTTNIDRQQGPAKFATMMMGGGRAETSCQLAALHRVGESTPAVAIMPGHDKGRMQELLGRGVFALGFQ